MKVLVYSVYFLSPVLERDLEIASNHLEKGDDLIFLRCARQLQSCLLNQKHRKSVCAYCMGKYDKGFEIAGIPPACIRALPPPPSDKSPEIPDVFENIDELMEFRYDGADLGVAVASTLIWNFNKDHRFSPVKYRDDVYKELNMCLYVYKTMLEILKDVKPDIVYFFNGRHSTTRPLMRACEKLGVTFYAHERAGVFSRYLLRKNAFPHDIDYAAREIHEVWEKGGVEREKIGAKFFENRKNRVEHAWFSFTKQQDFGNLPTGFDKTKKNIVIYNSTLQEMVGMQWFQNRVYRDEIDGIARILDSFKENPMFHFYLRLHPNLSEKTRKITPDNNTQLRMIMNLEKKRENVTVIHPDSVVDSYALLDAADIVIAFGSTMGVEATYWGKPSILAGAGAFYQYLDCCYNPKTHEELVDLLNSSPEPKSKKDALKYGYYELNKGEPYKKFKQTDVLKGEYEGTIIVPDFPTRLRAYIQRILEVRNKQELKAFISDLKKLSSRN